MKLGNCPRKPPGNTLLIIDHVFSTSMQHVYCRFVLHCPRTFELLCATLYDWKWSSYLLSENAIC